MKALREGVHQAGDAVRVGQRRHERLGEDAVELDGIQGAGVLDGLLKRVQRRVQVPVHLGLGLGLALERVSTQRKWCPKAFMCDQACNATSRSFMTPPKVHKLEC